VGELPVAYQRSLVGELARDRLTWWPELGVGYYPVAAGAAPYDADYFAKYVGYAATPLGRALTAARCDLVERYHRGALVDVGIGAGSFIAARRRRRQITYGWDVNPVALAWLDERRLLVDPHVIPFDAMSLWDALEHVADFRRLLANVRQWLFVSLPIFSDDAHVLRSKHFRRDEHYWYFTRDGLVAVLGTFGFALVEESRLETELGREDIGTFVFRRAPREDAA
jgi:hypothetical protein